MEWFNILTTLAGSLATIGGYGIFKFFTKNGQKEIRADADSKVQQAQQLMIANYEERIKDLHENIKAINESEHGYIERISQQNHALTDKTEQIRNLTEKVWLSEQETNKVYTELNDANKRITRLTEERDNYKMWQCRSKTCEKGNPDPEGRQPPNPKLKGMEFHVPCGN